MGENSNLPASEKGPLYSAFHSFRQNIAALRVFSEEVGKLVDQRDVAIIKEFNESLKALAESKDKDVALLPSSNKEEVSSDGVIAQQDAGDAGDAGEEKDRKSKHKIEISLDDPDKLRAFASSVTSFAQSHPIQGSILRRSAVINLMSHYESLIADLLHAYYNLFPDALPTSDRALTLSEILELGSLEEARAYLIEKEVDSVLRESLKQQHVYFTQRPKLKLDALSPFEHAVNEVDQRRNIYVHNRARVNKRYLKNVSSDLVKSFDAADGKVLKANKAYLAQAITMVFCSGIVLCQICWRKWQPKSIDLADSALIDTMYNSLKACHYDVVIALCEFARTIRFNEDVSRRVIIIDYAIAMKMLGLDEKVKETLENEDWSSCQSKFHVARHVLLGENEQAIATLKRAVRAEEVSSENIRDWPLFEELRGDADFIQLFGEMFPDEPSLDCLTTSAVSVDALLVTALDNDADTESLSVEQEVEQQEIEGSDKFEPTNPASDHNTVAEV